MSYDTRAIRELILEAFSEDEFSLLCNDHFKPLATNELAKSMTQLEKVSRLVAYCERQEKIRFLLDTVKKQNPGKFAKYEAQVEIGEGLGTEPVLPSGVRLSSAQTATAAHPLRGEAAEVRRWFADELGADEQIFAITAALFSGLERRELMDLYALTQPILRPAVAPAEPAPSPAASPAPAREDDRTIKLVIALDGHTVQSAPAGAPSPAAAPAAKSAFTDERRLFDRINLHFVDGTRNMEHGVTAVRLLEFEEGQREKLIDLLGESYSAVLVQLTPLLRQLAGEPRAAVRQRTAVAVGELMARVDFIRFKEEVLLPWAQSNSFNAGVCVAWALAIVVKDQRYAANVQALMRHWATSGNFYLMWTGLAAWAQLGELWPEEAVECLRPALEREHLDLLVLAEIVLRELGRAGHARDALRQLAEWSGEAKNTGAFRRTCLLVFLDSVELAFFEGEGGLRAMDEAVSLFLLALQNNQRLADPAWVQVSAIEKLRALGEAALGNEDRETLAATLYERLYRRAATPRERDRVAWHLKSWQKSDKHHRFSRIVPPALRLTA